MSFRSNCQLLSQIENQDNEEAKSFIKRENLYNAVDEENNTLLHYAVEYMNVDIVQFLIDSGSNVDAQNNLRQSPLLKSLQCYFPCKKVIEALLKAASNILLDPVFQSAIDIVNCIEWLNEDISRFEILKIFLELASHHASHMRLFPILHKGDEDLIKSLLQTNVNLSTADSRGVSIVHRLAVNLNPGVIEHLRGRNFDVDVSDFLGQTPLIYAVYRNNVSAIEFLLNEGADIEASSSIGKTALYIAIDRRNINSNTKKIVQILLEYGANVQVQIYNIHLDYIETIFDLLLEDENFGLVELPLAHLALQEAFGMIIDDFTRIRINAAFHLKSYYEYCQQQLFTEIHPSITLFDVLQASEIKLELYLHNEELASKLIDYETSICYFNTILCKRISNAIRMVELKKTAAEIVCNLMRIEYNSYPFVFDEIVNYLEEQDIENLILIQNLLF